VVEVGLLVVAVVFGGLSHRLVVVGEIVVVVAGIVVVVGGIVVVGARLKMP
jgi:hypothetical protein